LKNDIKSWIHSKTEQLISIEECICINHNRVLIISIPARPLGRFLTFHGMPLMRLDDKLTYMSQEMQKKILLEGVSDRSS
jgi:hypothetical protein